jgi:nucleoside-diphosphate-sugar epimerase
MGAEYLVTGGAGFIGSNIVHALLDQGRSVRVLDNFSTGRRANLADVASKIEIVDGDLREPDDVKRSVAGVKFVIHLGALPSVARSVEDPASTNEVNVTGTLRLLLAARDAGVERFVFSSSSSVYGNTPTLPKREDMLPEPLSPYALSKLAGEHYGRMFHSLYGLKTFSLRYFNVFGPRQNPKSDYAAVIPLFVDAFSNDRAPQIHGDGEQTRDFTYVADVVSANLACCTAPESAAGGVYNVAWGRRTSINELARTIAQLLGKKIEPVHTPSRAGDVRDSQADSTRARTMLGWKPAVTFEDGLARTVEWFKGTVRHA